MTLVAFHGRLGSGKDTAGERLASMVSCPTTRVSFARPLKESAAALMDIDVEMWEIYKNDPEVKILLQDNYAEQRIPTGIPRGGDLTVEAPNIIREFTAREFLQRYGTESHRGIFGDNFWVDQALVGYSPSPFDLTYITDCRFENEALAVLDHGGVVIRVVGANEETGAHASETPLSDAFVTGEIDNTVRGDDFKSLDNQLLSLASMLRIPLKPEALL